MKKFIFTLIFSLILTFPLSTFAHPVDTSTMLIYIGKDVSGSPLEPNKFEGVLTFNWLQLSAMTGENMSPVEIYQNFPKYEEMFNKYITSNLNFKSSNNICTYKLNRYSEDTIDLVISFGVKYEVTGSCESDIGQIEVTNNAFEDQVVTQSNIIEVFVDGKSVAKDDKGETSYSKTSVASSKVGKTTLNEKVKAYFNDILKSNNQWTIPIIFLTIYLMGALHSLEGGHNKMILGSLVVDKKVDFKQSMIFTIIFTITHMSDIILLSIGLLFLNRFIDLYSILPDITLYTILALIGISFFSLLKEARHILSHKLGHDHHHHDHDDHEHNHEHDLRNKSTGNALLMAFVSGLAPCLTGWSIFMLLFSTGRIPLILPGMLFFGLGVFTVLFVYTLILHKSKDAIISKIGWIGEYSTIISLTLVLVSAVIQLISII